MVANAARRSLSAGEDEVVPRICDLEALPASTAGKIEIETLEEGRDEQILDHLVRSAILTVFREQVPPESLTKVVEAFEERDPIEIGEDVPAADYVALLSDLPSLGAPVNQLDAVGGRAQYRARG
jgi:magnesium chelatase subunit I